MTEGTGGANLPFRWNLVRRDVVGDWVRLQRPPSLQSQAELVSCAAKVLARSGGGRLLFVGRSADSLFDFLSGVLAETPLADRIMRLPFSYRDDTANLSRADVVRARKILTACDVTPDRLVHGTDPIALIDLVSMGNTFTALYTLLRTWVDETDCAWSSARRKLRFVGITWRTHTSPKTWRWQQHTEWTRELPARSVINVSLDGAWWSYWGNNQAKLTPSFHRDRWADVNSSGPQRDPNTRFALAEAVSLVELGRTREARRAVARTAAREPAIKEPWLRGLLHQLR